MDSGVLVSPCMELPAARMQFKDTGVSIGLIQMGAAVEQEVIKGFDQSPHFFFRWLPLCCVNHDNCTLKYPDSYGAQVLLHCSIVASSGKAF